MGADIVNQAMSMGSMIQMAMESLVSPTITAVTTALFTAMFVGRKTEQKGLAGTKTTIFEEEIRTLLDNGRLSYREFNQIKNYLEVAEKADEFHKECGYDKVEPNTQYDIDWFIRFFDAASNADIIILLLNKNFIFVQTCFLQAHIIIVVHVVQTHNLDTLHRGEQSLCKVRTDKTSYTRDKNTLVSQIDFRFISVIHVHSALLTFSI